MADVASEQGVVGYLLLGTLGSVLPDMDSDSSAPLRASFSLAAVAAAFLAMFISARFFSTVAELVLIWIAAFLLSRWLVFSVFTRLTSHRGVFHSIPAAILFGLLAAALGERIAGLASFEAWLAGTFVTFGYLVHLVLDELYAVNLFGTRTRRSFGSALKLYSRASPRASVCLYAAVLAMFLLSPKLGSFAGVVVDTEVHRSVQERLLPEGGWFRPGAGRSADTVQ